MDNNFSFEDITNPLLITCIVVLICNLVIFTDDSDSDFDVESTDHNIYKIINKDSDHTNNDNFEDVKNQKIYKILNDGDNHNKNAIKIHNDNDNTNIINNTNTNVINNTKKSDSDDKYLNKNIFLPYKTKNMKFQLKT